jgi:hypothetical protein
MQRSCAEELGVKENERLQIQTESPLLYTIYISRRVFSLTVVLAFSHWLFNTILFSHTLLRVI